MPALFCNILGLQRFHKLDHLLSTVMKQFTRISSIMLAIVVSGTTFAQQTTTDTTRRSESILSDTTRRELREAGQEVKEAAREVGRDVREATGEVKEKTRETARELREESRETGREFRETIDRVRRNREPAFGQGAVLIGANLGFGTGERSSYLIFNPRIAYFIQSGVAVGFKMALENRLTTSYRANMGGAFIRYYPIRNRFFLFGEGGFSLGRFRTSLVGDDPQGFASMNLGLGAGYQILPNLGVEFMYDHNFYDKTPEFAGRNRGPQVKAGITYNFVSRR